MQIVFHTKKSPHLPYEALIEAFNAFNFDEGVLHQAEGQIKKHTGRCHFAFVTLTIQKRSSYNEYGQTLNWEVTNDQIPIDFMDAVMVTIKTICSGHQDFYHLRFGVISGQFHAVDTSIDDFETATFRAIANLIGFDLQNKTSA